MANLLGLKEHARLFDRMGKAVGLDLQEEAISGQLQFDEIAEAVLRCSHCSAPGACQRLLAKCDAIEAKGDEPLGKAIGSLPPQFCRNADLFDYLQHSGE